MASTVEGLPQKDIHALLCELVGDKTCRNPNHIRIIVMTSERSDLRVPGECTTYPLMLIDSHRYTISTSTHRNTPLALPSLDCKSERMSKIGIIRTLLRVGPKIRHLMSSIPKMLQKSLLILVTRMVTRNGYLHIQSESENQLITLPMYINNLHGGVALQILTQLRDIDIHTARIEVIIIGPDRSEGYIALQHLIDILA